MPRAYIEGLDDALSFESLPSFDGGQNSFSRPDAIAPNQAAELVNWDISQHGILTTRRGRNEVTSGPISVEGEAVRALYYFDKPGLKQLVAAHNGRIWTWSSGPTWTQLGSPTFDKTLDIRFAPGLEKMFILVPGVELYQWDGTTMTTLSAAPKGVTMCYHTNAVFIGGATGYPDQLARSDFLDASVWNGLWSIQVGAGEGDPIVAIVSYEGNNIVVFKRNSIWLVTAMPQARSAAEWQVTRIHDAIGCVAARTAIQVGQDVWFLADDGVRSLQRTAATLQQEIAMPTISGPIQDLINRINWPLAPRSCAIHYNNRYMLSVPLDDAIETATGNNTTLVYNTLRQAWQGSWLKWEPTAFTPTFFSNIKELCFGSRSGRVWRWRDQTSELTETPEDYEDVMTPIETKLVTRSFSFNDPVARKKPFSVEIEFYRSLEAASLWIQRDLGSEEVVALNFASATPTLKLPFTLTAKLGTKTTRRVTIDLYRFDSFKQAQFILRAPKGKIALRHFIVSAYEDALDYETYGVVPESIYQT
jgi:hypothetical protein